MRLLHHHLDEDRRSHHDTTVPTSPVLSTSTTATTSTADTEPQGQPPPPPLNMSQESSRSRIEPVTAGGAGGTNCCSVNKRTQDDKKKKRKKNVPEALRSPLQQAKGDASSNTSRRAASRATGSHNSMSINMLVGLLLFVVLTGAGITVHVVMLQAGEAAMRNEAKQAAVEVGDFFAKELDLAILPLFSMTQFATELDQFVGLPRAIEPLPFMQSESLNVVMRNVSGICNDPAVLEKFNHIVASIKNSSHTDGVLHNIQLSPQGILCLAYPLNNADDFVHTARPDSFLDVSGAIGLDLMNEPEHMYIAKSTMIQDEVGIAGPRPLLQCANCGLYFIVRLPIYSATHEINVDGKLYPRWGFATALINWDALVARSRVHERFKARGFTFQLTRTDHTYNSTTQTDGSNVVILTESHGFAARPRGCGQVVTALQTTNNEWTMTVVYKHQDKLWVPMLAILAILVVSCFVSSLIYTVLMQRQAHAAMQGTAMAQHAKVEIERHMTGT
jgi:CHASE domain